MIAPRTFNFYVDPGHGWVKVPKKLLKKLEIDEKITAYSYMRNDQAYLEEDLDLSTFIKAMQAKGYKVAFKDFHTNKTSKIRNYDAYLRTWDTDELQKDFEVESFLAPYVVVRRKSNGAKGYMIFNDRPRYYFDFKPLD
jgi:hypothetical protein